MGYNTRNVECAYRSPAYVSVRLLCAHTIYMFGQRVQTRSCPTKRSYTAIHECAMRLWCQDMFVSTTSMPSIPRSSHGGKSLKGGVGSAAGRRQRYALLGQSGGCQPDSVRAYNASRPAGSSGIPNFTATRPQTQSATAE